MSSSSETKDWQLQLQSGDISYAFVAAVLIALLEDDIFIYKLRYRTFYLASEAKRIRQEFRAQLKSL